MSILFPVLLGHAASPPSPSLPMSGLLLFTRFPGVTARAGDLLSFPLTVENNGLPAGPVRLEVTAAPPGWATTFRGGGATVNRVFVPTDEQERLDLQVSLPEEAAEEKYQLTVRAATTTAASTLQLEIAVVGPQASAATLTARYPTLQGPADATYEFRVDLRNDGGAAELFSLAAQAPAGCEVSFAPGYEQKRITTLSVDAGASQSINVTVTPPARVAAGDYTVQVVATTGQVRAETDLQVTITGQYALNLTTPSGRLNVEATAGQQAVVPLTLETPAPTIWGMMGLGLVAAVVLGVGRVFRTYGRR